MRKPPPVAEGACGRVGRVARAGDVRPRWPRTSGVRLRIYGTQLRRAHLAMMLALSLSALAAAASNDAPTFIERRLPEGATMPLPVRTKHLNALPAVGDSPQGTGGVRGFFPDVPALAHGLLMFCFAPLDAASTDAAAAQVPGRDLRADPLRDGHLLPRRRPGLRRQELARLHHERRKNTVQSVSLRQLQRSSLD